MTEPLFLTAVLRIANEVTPAIIIQESSGAGHTALLRLLRSHGGTFPRISPAELGRSSWSLAMGTQIDVSEGVLARVHIPAAAKSIVPADELPMSALWMVAASGRRRVLLAVAEPGVFDADRKPDEIQLYSRLGQAAGRRALHGGLAEFHVDRVLRRPNRLLAPVRPGASHR